MNSVKKAIIDTAKDALATSNLFISGFELEFHACNGKRFTGERQMENDYDAARIHLQSNSSAIRVNTLIELAGRLTEEELATFKPKADLNYTLAILKQNRSNSVEAFNTMIGRIDTTVEGVPEALAKINRVVSSLISLLSTRTLTVTDLQNLVDMGRFQREVRQSRIYNLPDAMTSLVEIKRDGTVRGGEIVLSNPLNPVAALGVAAELFNTNKWEIDEGCSFHIHLSVPGVQHSYSQALQWELMLYVLSQYERMPVGVKARWKRSLDYFRTHIAQEKYSFVHFHPQYKTWEFRCFGNVSDLASAETCYAVALEAIQHAYKVQAGIEKSLSLNMFDCSNHNRVFKNIGNQLASGKFSLTEVNELIAAIEAA